MGCFSWMFADKANKKALGMGAPGYLMAPDGSVYYTDCYDGYGRFGPKDSVDAYAACADWNREFLAAHPDYTIPQHGHVWSEDAQDYVKHAAKRISEEPWWPFYSDLSMTHEDIEKAMKMQQGTVYWEYRCIGIDIACYDDQNAALPYPIKIASVGDIPYTDLPPSNGDPHQGLGAEYWAEYDDSDDDEEDDEDGCGFSWPVSSWTNDANGKPVCEHCGSEPLCDHGGHYKKSAFCPCCGSRMIE